VIPNAMMYFGASLGRKMLVEIRPAALASGTPTALSTARLVSLKHHLLEPLQSVFSILESHLPWSVVVVPGSQDDTS
jgi:hypothetical protein